MYRRQAGTPVSGAFVPSRKPLRPGDLCRDATMFGTPAPGALVPQVEAPVPCDSDGTPRLTVPPVPGTGLTVPLWSFYVIFVILILIIVILPLIF